MHLRRSASMRLDCINTHKFKRSNILDHNKSLKIFVRARIIWIIISSWTQTPI